MSSGWGPYLRQEEAKANLCKALGRAGATIFGWREGESDPMTDYFRADRWDGIATYDGYTIVVAISRLDLPQSGVDGWPTFQMVQKGYTWHVEQNGEIVAKGKGLNACTRWHHRKARSMSAEEDGVTKSSDALAAKLLGIIDRLNGKGREPMLSQPKPVITGMEPMLSQPKPVPTQQVYIPAREVHNGYDGIYITLAWVCPKCGGPRGEVFKTRSYDGSRILYCDGWKNDCGHVDLYVDCRKEAVANGLNTKCTDCNGHGADPMSDNVNWLQCQKCGGSGKRN